MTLLIRLYIPTPLPENRGNVKRNIILAVVKINKHSYYVNDFINRVLISVIFNKQVKQ